jgi:hypothetical protein
LQSRQRPAIVTLLGLGVLTLAAVFLIRLAVGLRSPSLPNTIPAWYLPLTGAFWGMGGLVVAYGLLTGKPWAPTFARLGALAFTASYWADRLLLSRSDYSALTRPADATINLVAILVLLWGLHRNVTRHYFGENAL